MIRDLLDEGWVGWMMLGLLGLTIALVPLIIWGAIEENAQWKAFSAEHACKVVGKMSGSSTTTVAPIIGGNGGVAIGVSSTPSKTGYLCDDGVTYWR